MAKRMRFSEVATIAGGRPGMYEVQTLRGVPLKVGIAGDLKVRLLQHAASLQSRLKLKPNGSWRRPRDVASKGSVLAKHLFFDRSITKRYRLRTQAGRRRFLENQCRVLIHSTHSRSAARAMEKARERTGRFRYTGAVRWR